MARKISIQVVGDSRSLEKAFQKAGKAADNFGKKMAHLSKKRAFGGTFKAAGIGGLFAGAGVAALGIDAGVSSVKAATNYESVLARTEGLAGQTHKQVMEWADELLALGPAIGKKPQELAEALYFAASSGIKVTQVLGAVRQGAMASSAGLGETKVVTDALTSIMNAYASSGMSAVHATDALVATVREGKGEADQFAGTIGNVAAFASRLHVPIEQVGAALAAMTQLGTDPHTAATQLSAFFSSVLKVSAGVQKKADKMGFSFENLTGILASGDLRGALQYIKDFASSHGGIQSLALMFPNIRALRALLALTADDGGKVAGIFDRMNKSAGSNKKAYDKSAKTSQHAWDRFHAAVQSVRIAFGQGLLPLVTKVANAIANKLADPKVIARIRHMGKEFAKTLERIGDWFIAHWPGIKKGFGQLAHIAQRIAHFFERAAFYYGKLPNMPTGKEAAKWVGNYGGDPGHYKQFVGWEKIFGHKAAMDRARDQGWITRVRDKETGDIILVVDGHELGRITAKHHQRAGKRHAGQTRGRYGGDAVAIP